MLRTTLTRLVRKPLVTRSKLPYLISNQFKINQRVLLYPVHRYFCDKPKDDKEKEVLKENEKKEDNKKAETQPEKEKIIHSSQRVPINWKSLRIYAVIVVGLVGLYNYLKKQKQKKMVEQTSRTFGKPALGGQWTLVDHNGVPFTDASLNQGGDKFALLYFGFTFCPDICPAELIKMKRIIERLDTEAEFKELVFPVFISVDPHRDGVAQVRHYIKDFHERTVGLTGTVDQVSEACKRFRVYHSIADRDLEEEDDYVVDHSIVMYLIGPDGKFMDFYTQLTEVGEAVKRIKEQIRNYKPETESEEGEEKEVKGKEAVA